MRLLEAVDLAADELEALRLADLDDLYQEQAAEQMGVSRQTFGVIVARARRKVADALTGGKAIRIEGIELPSPAGRPGCRHGGRRGRGWQES